MRCPFCDHDTSTVTDTRLTEEGQSIRRRRQCPRCRRRFSTYERINDLKVFVIKKDRRREPFSRQKIYNGVMLACKKLPISLKQIEDVVNSIEVSVYDRQQKEINSKDIGDLVMEALRGLNHVAYVRFASYYREFRDVNDFIEVAREVKPPSRQRHKRR